MEIQYIEQVDKYRVEFNKPTTGGKIGFSVRVTGNDKHKTMAEAVELATKAIAEAEKLQGE
jgi:hypothetical protein